METYGLHMVTSSTVTGHTVQNSNRRGDPHKNQGAASLVCFHLPGMCTLHGTLLGRGKGSDFYFYLVVSQQVKAGVSQVYSI